MIYRGKGFHRRFNGDKDGTYVADDRGEFDRYMEDQGYDKPVEVWLRAINTIIDMDVNVESKWHAKLHSEIYPPDAALLIAHVELYILACCTPAKPGDEFT